MYYSELAFLVSIVSGIGLCASGVIVLIITCSVEDKAKRAVLAEKALLLYALAALAFILALIFMNAP